MESPPVKLDCQISDSIGYRNAMEDVSFIIEEAYGGILVGILDGHGGSHVAVRAGQLIRESFSEHLLTTFWNVHQTLEKLFYEVNNKIISSHFDCDAIGATAVISFLDQKKGIIYTATLGDCEVCLYRSIDKNLKVIPLSNIRHFASKNDLQRVVDAEPKPSRKELIKKYNLDNAKNPKKLRYCPPNCDKDLNVSRAFGDKLYVPVVSCKPKITIHNRYLMILLVFSCDGLKDYVPEKDIVDQVKIEQSGTKLSDRLVEVALKNMPKAEKKETGDNVSVIVCKVLRKKREKILLKSRLENIAQATATPHFVL